MEDIQPVAPSAIAFSAEYPVPEELSPAGIRQVITDFTHAARRAVTAGFDAVEIHGAHGYLINQFLSPLSNHRTDEYGGSPAKRSRLLGEVVAAVKAVIPDGMPLSVRVSAHDYEQGGNTPDTVAAMLNIVKDAGIDMVNVSSGAVTPVAPRAYAGYQIPFAQIVKEKTGLPVIGGGLISTAVQAQQVVKAGVDLVWLGRELLRSPYWPLKAAYELGAEVTWPEPYLRGKF